MILRILPMLLGLLTSAQAAKQVYGIAEPLDPKSISFELKYSLGTHTGSAKSAHGSLQVDLSSLETVSGIFSVPIVSLETGKAELNCHMWESLGLDYGPSDFPDSHVCESDDQLPKSGNNAVVFPEIRLILEGIKRESADPLTQESQLASIKGKWEIHGVKRDIPADRFKVKIWVENDRLHVQGQDSIRLADHGIEVKNFLFITVKDEALAKIELALEKQK